MTELSVKINSKCFSFELTRKLFRVGPNMYKKHQLKKIKIFQFSRKPKKMKYFEFKKFEICRTDQLSFPLSAAQWGFSHLCVSISTFVVCNLQLNKLLFGVSPVFRKGPLHLPIRLYDVSWCIGCNETLSPTPNVDDRCTQFGICL